MIKWLKSVFNPHKHNWVVVHDSIYNPKNGCEYTSFKCECGKKAVHTTYPDGHKFIGIIE